MIGLLIKDIKLMKNQIVFFVIAIVCGLILIPNQQVVGAWVLSFVIANFAIGSMTYDDFDNGSPFLFTLPFSRKQYVKEKYLFALIIGSLLGILLLIYLMIYQSIVNKEINIFEIMFLESLVIALTLFMLSILFPIQFKYGSEKGKMVNLAVMGVGLIIIFAIDKIIQTDSVSIMVTEKMNTLSIGTVYLLMTIAIYYISLLISKKIISKREF